MAVSLNTLLEINGQLLQQTHLGVKHHGGHLRVHLFAPTGQRGFSARLLHGTNLEDSVALLDGAELHETLMSFLLRFVAVNDVLVNALSVADVSDPVLQQSQVLILSGSLHRAATIVSRNDDVLHAQHFHGKLDHRQHAQVASNNKVSHVAMYKHFAGTKAKNFIGWDAGVAAANVEVLRHLFTAYLFKEIRVSLFAIFHPFLVVNQ